MRPWAHQRLGLNSRRSSVFTTNATSTSFKALEEVLEDYQKAPPSFKQEITGDVKKTMEELKASGGLPKWGIETEKLPERRNVSLGELRMMGVKEPEAIAKVSVRNDAAFLMTTVGASSVGALVLGQLPGDWGFWACTSRGESALPCWPSDRPALASSSSSSTVFRRCSLTTRSESSSTRPPTCSRPTSSAFLWLDTR